MPLTFVQRKARNRINTLDRRLPDLIDLMTVMIEAGLSFSQSLRLAAEQFAPPLSDELRLTLQEQTMGLSIDEALSHMADRADTPAMRSFVRTMSQGERMGISLGQIMRNLAHEMRARRRAHQPEERAQKTPDALPARLPDLPGDVHRPDDAGRDQPGPQPQGLLSLRTRRPRASASAPASASGFLKARWSPFGRRNVAERLVHTAPATRPSGIGMLSARVAPVWSEASGDPLVVASGAQSGGVGPAMASSRGSSPEGRGLEAAWAL